MFPTFTAQARPFYKPACFLEGIHYTPDCIKTGTLCIENRMQERGEGETKLISTNQLTLKQSFWIFFFQREQLTGGFTNFC